MLRRLKSLEASTDEMIDVYEKQIRCSLEFSVPVWAAGITVEEANLIERVQKAAFSIILGDAYKSYKSALNELKMTTLASRRKELCLKFAQKSQKSEKFGHWFCKRVQTDQNEKTRSKFSEYLPVLGRTKGFSKKSPIAYFTSLLREAFQSKKQRNLGISPKW